jgi:ATP-dependent helicase/nuclease subunit A
MATTVSTMRFPNTIVQASAGSGKTYALTNRYLQLIASGVPCDTILATTFTRKAAGEILDRIMQRLTAAAADPLKCAELAEVIDFPLQPQKAKELLRQMAENLHRLQVSTLDSFFFQIARAFNFEMGLPVDWKIAETGQIGALAEIAVRKLLHDRNTREFLHLITKNDAERKIADIMIREVEKYNEVYRDSTREAWNHSSPGARNFRELVGPLVERFEQRPLVNKRMTKPLEADLAAVARGDWEALVKSNAVGRVIDGNFIYYNSPVDGHVIAFYQSVIEALRAFVTTVYADRTASAYRLIDSFSNELWPMQMEAAELKFSDVTHVLQKLMRKKGLDLEFRLDMEVRHLLLDEFQDTSPAQWQILQPFVHRLFSTERRGSFFCVGDRKQAIYAWRGGVSEIFDVVQAQLGDRLESTPPLSTSYRSSPVVIEAVNQVFQNLTNTGIDREPDRAVLEHWQEAFPHHTTARDTLPGYVRVEIADNLANDDPADDEVKNPVLARTVQAIESLHQQSPALSIGVLVGAHSDIARILFELHKRGIPASEEGGNSLEDSAAVNLMLAILKLADHPSDGISRFLLSHSPLAERFGLLPEDQSTAAANRLAVEHASLAIRRELLANGFGKTLERLADELDPHCTSRERRRLDQLIECAFEYNEPWTLRASHFIQQIRRDKILEPSAAAIRVMTVHASKGLEFDAVVAPFFGLTGKWSAHQAELVCSRSNPAEPIDCVHLYCGKEERAFLPPRIQAVFDQHRRVEVNERICVLYVWMTRAIHHLHMILPKQTGRGQTSMASVVLSTLSSRGGNSELVYEGGDPDWNHKLERKPASTAKDGTEVFFEPFQAAAVGAMPPAEPAKQEDGVPKAITRSKKHESHETVVDGSHLETLAERNDVDQALRFCLMQIDWLERLPTDGKLKNLLRGECFSTQVISDVLQRFRQMCTQPGFTKLFDRKQALDCVYKERYRPVLPLFEPLKLTVSNNHPIDVRLGRQQIVGRIDRLVLMYEGDLLFGADIVCLDTVSKTAEEIAESAQRLRPVVANYHRAVASCFQLKPTQVSARLYATAADVETNLTSLK